MRTYFSAILFLFPGLFPRLSAQTTTSTYYYAHSLIWHQKLENNQANIPFWLAELEKAAGDKCLTSGKHVAIHWDSRSAKLPPPHSWAFNFSNHGSAMTPDGPYPAGKHNHVLLTYMNWEIIYDWGSDIGKRNPNTVPKATDSIAVIFDWLNKNDSGINLFLYECWPKLELNYIMGGNNWNLSTGSPPNQAQWTKYLNYATGYSNDFWKDLQDQLITKAGVANTRLIPSSLICAKLWKPGGLLSDVPAASIFEDLGPHGKPSSYFLAAMIVYAAQHKKAPVKPFNDHTQIDQKILDRFSDIGALIMSELSAFNFPDGKSRVWGNTTSRVEAPMQARESKIRIYPIPAEAYLTLDLSAYAYLSGCTLHITNTTGATIFKSAINQELQIIDVNQWLKQGMYFVYIVDNNGKTIDQNRFVIP